MTAVDAPANEASVATSRDLDDHTVAAGATGLLGEFNLAGILDPADVHVARRLAELFGEKDETVALAFALAVRAPRLGSVCADLLRLPDLADGSEGDPGLTWPDQATWRAAVARSPLVVDGERPAGGRPLRLVGDALYLERYWADEQLVAEEILHRSRPASGVDKGVLAEGVARLCAPSPSVLSSTLSSTTGGGGTLPDDLPRLAAATAVLRQFTVLSGGPGTGKTWTVAVLVALLCEQAAAGGQRLPHVALAAPTGKAAARLGESVREWVGQHAGELAPEIRDHMLGLRTSTLHRLLARRPGSRNRFRFSAENLLPHDVVIVDETSMMALSMMARLLEAVRSEARVVLVGDHEQLASVEAGAVLADVVGDAVSGLRMTPAARDALVETTGSPVDALVPPPGVTVGDGIVVLRHSYRFGRGISELAVAIQSNDPDRVMEVLDAAPSGVRFIPTETPWAEHAAPAVRTAAVESGAVAVRLAKEGDAAAALEALARFRLLCAHRQGPYGVAVWQELIEQWLTEAVDGFGSEGTWYAGRPLLVTANDYDLRLFNGDTGVVVRRPDGRLEAAFDHGEEPVRISPSRLSDVETAFAMTVHKAQGSQFSRVAVIVPDESSRILTRELLYTGVTRAREEVLVVGTEAAVRAAVLRPVARASGLRRWLWEERDTQSRS